MSARRIARALAVLALAAAAPAAGAQAPHHQLACQHRRGRTILRRGEVRVYKAAGPVYTAVYGCVIGSARTVQLWEVVPGAGPAPQTTGSVKRVAGPFVAVETSTSNQYEHTQTLQVLDLRSGAGYTLSATVEPIDEPVALAPRLEAYVLAADGRTAALYATFPTGASTGSAAPSPTGQILEVRGLHAFRHVLATAGSGAIVPASLAFNGETASWTQGGEARSAGV